MYGIILFCVIVVTGGFIAVIGDRTGMKIGKKRLSMFGLRPKHTSMLVTVITGASIALASLLFMAIASHNVRIALFHMDEIRNELDMTQRKLDYTTKEVQKKEELANALARQIGVMIRRKEKQF